MMNDKIAINPQRLNWYLETFNISLEDLSKTVEIGLTTLRQAINNKPVINIMLLIEFKQKLKENSIMFNRIKKNLIK